ncbi:MAG: AzlD domain-containing protein [Clostridia bacterium]|nr:AzlD domain-containing protein [Clostridia bacterium]
MNSVFYSALLVAVMSAATILLRALPFLVFKNKAPAYVVYLGRVLPAAIIGMLVVYCLKDTAFLSAPFGAPEVVAGLAVVGLQAWKRNILLSILAGTACYMLLTRLVF